MMFHKRKPSSRSRCIDNVISGDNQVAFVRQESQGEEPEPPALVTSTEAICKRFGDSDMAITTCNYFYKFIYIYIFIYR